MSDNGHDNTLTRLTWFFVGCWAFALFLVAGVWIVANFVTSLQLDDTALVWVGYPAVGLGVPAGAAWALWFKQRTDTQMAAMQAEIDRLEGLHRHEP